MLDLNEAQLQAIEERLAEREAELRTRVREAKEEEANRPSALGAQVEDIAEQGEQRFRTGMEHVEMLRDQEELTAIAETRTRITEGRYGECIDCGQPINFERLLVQPTAKRCIADQEAWEKKHGSMPRFIA